MKTISVYLLLICLFACHWRSNEKPKLPEFEALLIDSTTFINTGKIPEGKPLVFLYISPTCEACQRETKSILMKMDSLSSVHIYFLAIESFSDFKDFNEYFGLGKYSNVTLLWDYSHAFPQYFNNYATPFVAIYTANKELKTVLKGEFDGSRLVKEIYKL